MFTLNDVGSRVPVKLQSLGRTDRILDKGIVMVIKAPRGQVTIFYPETRDGLWDNPFAAQAAAVRAFMEQHKND